MKHFHSVFPLIITTYDIHCILITMGSHFAYLSSLSGSHPCPGITVAGINNADSVNVSKGDGTDDYEYGSKVSVISLECIKN